MVHQSTFERGASQAIPLIKCPVPSRQPLSRPPTSFQPTITAFIVLFPFPRQIHCEIQASPYTTVTNNVSGVPQISPQRAPLPHLLPPLLALRHAVLAENHRPWPTRATGDASRLAEPRKGVQIALYGHRAVSLPLRASFSRMGPVLPPSNPI